MRPSNVPEAWSLWFDREAAENPEDVRIISFMTLLNL